MHIYDTTPIGNAIAARAVPTVLLVEDNDGDVNLIREGFQEAGLAVRLMCASTGSEAYCAIRLLPATDLPRLVILDISIPVLSGMHLLAEFGRDARWRAIPKVILTSSTREADRAFAEAAGATGYFVKPTTFAELVVIIERLRAYLDAPVRERL